MLNWPVAVEHAPAGSPAVVVCATIGVVKPAVADIDPAAVAESSGVEVSVQPGVIATG